MIVRLQKGLAASELDLSQWSVAIHGNVIDDRGRAAVTEVVSRARRSFSMRYDPANFEVNLDGTTVSVDDFDGHFSDTVSGSIVLEATTLGFVEILLCCRTLIKEDGITTDIIYVEPEMYRSPRREYLLHRRDFELSDVVTGYRGIPGSSFF